jgi:hypothetical protein
VALATWGLDSDMHMPKGGTFSAATSVTTPAGLPADTLVPEEAKVAGVVPNEHCSVAPVQTTFGMAVLPLGVTITAPGTASYRNDAGFVKSKQDNN